MMEFLFFLLFLAVLFSSGAIGRSLRVVVGVTFMAAMGLVALAQGSSGSEAFGPFVVIAVGFFALYRIVTGPSRRARAVAQEED